MPFNLPRSRLLALWGLVAALTLALLPTVSHAVASTARGAAAGALDVCTSPRSISAVLNGEPLPQSEHTLFDDCPLCPLAATVMTLPPPVAPWLAASGSADLAPAVRAAPGPRERSRPTPPPRAPPARS